MQKCEAHSSYKQMYEKQGYETHKYEKQPAAPPVSAPSGMQKCEAHSSYKQMYEKQGYETHKYEKQPAAPPVSAPSCTQKCEAHSSYKQMYEKQGYETHKYEKQPRPALLWPPPPDPSSPTAIPSSWTTSDSPLAVQTDSRNWHAKSDRSGTRGHTRSSHPRRSALGELGTPTVSELTAEAGHLSWRCGSYRLGGRPCA